jgi:hypothetical protein
MHSTGYTPCVTQSNAQGYTHAQRLECQAYNSTEVCMPGPCQIVANIQGFSLNNRVALVVVVVVDVCVCVGVFIAFVEYRPASHP